jgi:predicted small secreted protein
MAAGAIGAYAAAMKTSFRNLTVVLLVAAFVALVTTGCQTSKGFGKDMENLGEKIQDKAK